MQTKSEIKTAAIIMAAGKGTRMKSDLPKVLHKILGQPVLFRVLNLLKTVQSTPNVVVVGHQAQMVESACREKFDDLKFAEQTVQKGTGHAVQTALSSLDGFDGRVLILSGDMPLFTEEVLHKLLNISAERDDDFTLLSAISPEFRSFGRIVRNADGGVISITEAKDCTPEELAIEEVNLGAYCAKAEFLREFLPKLSPNNAQGEYYLTDLVKLGSQAGRRIDSLVTEDITCAMGVNNRADLAKAAAALRQRRMNELMLSGVTILDPQSTWIEEEVSIAPDAEIWPGTVLCGTTAIGGGCRIGPNTQITDSTIGSGCSIVHSVLNQAVVEDNVNIGPFAYLRPNAHIASNAKVGDFVEIKNANIGTGTKVPHLTYVGDADVGSGTNIGCGTITCNYDGRNKHRTVIGDNVFIGSNSSLVAPVTVGSNAKTGAGAVIIRDVPEGSVVVGVPAKPIHSRDN